MALGTRGAARTVRRLRLALALLAAVPAAGAASVNAVAVAAVLSAETGPYEQALAGLREELGPEVAVRTLAVEEPRLPERVRVVVAFGAKAALLRYPAGVPVIYAMAPGVGAPGPRGAEIVVAMTPAPAVLLARLRELQPGLRRLGVLWQSEYYAAYIAELSKAAAAAGVELDAPPVGPHEAIQDRLRRLYDSRCDAVWLMPDPLLIGAQNLRSSRDFSWSNKIPLYVPTEGLVGHGALASVGISFREIGREAARAARRTLAGEASAGTSVYPERVEISVNLTAAERLGVTVPDAVLRRADKVLP